MSDIVEQAEEIAKEVEKKVAPEPPPLEIRVQDGIGVKDRTG